MEDYKCESCNQRERCPIEHMAEWMKEHEGEVTEARAESSPALARAGANFCELNPFISLTHQLCVTILSQCFAIGYHAGRTHIPAVFKEA